MNYKLTNSEKLFNFFGGLGVGGVIAGGNFSYGGADRQDILNSLIKLTEKTFTEILMNIIEKKAKKFQRFITVQG